MTESSRVVIPPDSRSAEAFLLAEIERLRPLGARPDALAPPVRVVVPSHSLRSHLLAKLAARRPAWLGLEVATLRTTARAILAGAGETPPRGGSLLPILIERAGRKRRPLAAAFGDFADGWAPLAAAARDLLDAGFEPALAEAVLERIAAEGDALPARALERARSLVESLVEALEELERLGSAPDSRLPALAAETLARRGREALPASAIFVHGFADATGVSGDLLCALVRHAGATALLVDPLDSDRRASGFGSRLRERLEGAGGLARAIEPAFEPARLAAFAAPTPALEARTLAVAASAALGEGVRAEEIAIVYREPAAARSALWRELERRGVPFSASAATGPIGPLAHRAEALLGLLDRRGEAPADAALELLDGLPELAEHRAGVRLALRALGIARIGATAHIDRRPIERLGSSGFPLPVRAGIELDADGGETAPRRRLPVPALLAALDRLRALLATVEAWPRVASWPRHVAALARVLALTPLGAEDDVRRLRASAEAFEIELPPDFELSAEEAFALLARAWRAEERVAWGGAGGGVQVLSVTEARGRTFERLFVGGLVRGRFPRLVADEPVLPDPLRLRLRELLPDLPVKREGHEEERFLFAQLLGAAPGIVLGRSQRDDDGRPLPASPLLDALERRGTLAAHTPGETGPEPALDRAIAAALAGREAALAPHLGPALEEGRRRFAPAAAFDSAAAAAARCRVLTEFDTDPTSEEGRRRIAALGPYFGFVGARGDLATVAATTLEALAACGWKAFLERTLRLEPTPDPLQALPGIDPLLLGSATHDALARLFGDGATSGESLGASLSTAGRELRWPAPETVAGVAAEAATGALAAAGLAGRGLERLLAHRIGQRLAVARELDVALGEAELLGVELDGEIVLEPGAGRTTTVRFRADRLHREGERLVFVDFKTGRVPAGLDAKTEETRHEHLLAGVRSGQRLQAALYALSVAPRAADARYHFLAPDDDPPERSIGLAGDDETSVALRAGATTLLDALRLGLHPPRLLDAKLEQEYAGCEYCAVAEACVQRDSGFRLRLERWHAHEAARDGRRREREEALWKLWRLPAREEAER